MGRIALAVVVGLLCTSTAYGQVVSSGRGGSSSITLANVGSTPSAKAASLVSGVLTLQPADATNPGFVSTGAQTFGGTKTFADVAVSGTLTVAGASVPTASSSTTFTNKTFSDTINANSTGAAVMVPNGYLHIKSGGGLAIWKDSTPTKNAWIGLSATPGGTLDNDLIFATGSGTWAERMRIAATGTVTVAGALAPGSITVQAWQSVTFTNSWVQHADTTFTAAGYYKDPTGRVFLRGLIASGTLGSAAFTLPVGYRPTKSHMFAVASSTATGTCEARVFDTGGVAPQSACNNTYVSLDGISFQTL